MQGRKYTTDFHQKLMATAKPTYFRPHYNSTMSAPEWRNVEMAKDYADYLKDGRSMFTFPYFRQTFDLWGIIFKSYKHARKYDTMRNILTSEYMVMDLFIGFFTTCELIPKGILSLFLRPFLPAQNKTEMQAHIADYYTNYHKDLQTIPFYDQEYVRIRNALAAKYRDCKDRTWLDWLTWRCVSLELTARAMVSGPLHNWFHDPNNLVTPETQVLVKFKAPDVDNEDAAIALFKAKIASVSDEARPSIEGEVHAIPKKSNKDGQHYIAIYARLNASRYGVFQTTVKELGEQGICIKKIAGNDQVQVKCVVEAETVRELQERINQLNKLIDNVTPLYTYGDGINDKLRYCLFDVPTKNLHVAINKFNAPENGTRVQFIHNF